MPGHPLWLCFYIGSMAGTICWGRLGRQAAQMPGWEMTFPGSGSGQQPSQPAAAGLLEGTCQTFASSSLLKAMLSILWVKRGVLVGSAGFGRAKPMCQYSSSRLLLCQLPWDIPSQLKPNFLPVQPYFIATSKAGVVQQEELSNDPCPISLCRVSMAVRRHFP